MAARVLVTGLRGFTGRYVERALTAQGYTVLDPESLAPGFDLTAPVTIAAAFSAGRPDHVIHLAAISFVGHGDAGNFYRVNTVGTANLLDAAAAAEHPVTKLVVASSANIYGNTAAGTIAESAPAAPANHYAGSKVAMELMTRPWAERLSIVVARPFNYTGVGQAEQFLVPKIVAHFRRRLPVIELGNLDVARDFSDVRDVAAAYCRLLTAPAGEAYNICSGESYSLGWIVDECRAITGHDIAVVVNPAFVRANEVKRLVGDGSKLAGLPGHQATYSFGETLRWMLAV